MILGARSLLSLGLLRSLLSLGLLRLVRSDTDDLVSIRLKKRLLKLHNLGPNSRIFQIFFYFPTLFLDIAFGH